jgi:di/tricarboxylate transporter
MSPESIYLGCVLLAAIVVFYKGWLETGTTAFAVMLSLMVPWRPSPTGLQPILAPAEALSGFGSPAVLMVAAMFVLSAAMVKTGAARMLGDRLLRACAGSELRLQLAILAIVTLFSAVINDTTAVLIWMPMVLSICRERGYAPSRLLILLAFASLLGGQWTLIGTRSNIVISDYLTARTGEGLGFFEFTPAAAAVWAVCIAAFLLFGRRLLPRPLPADSPAAPHEAEEFLTEAVLEPESENVGRTLSELDLERRCGITILSVHRDGDYLTPEPHVRLEARDSLVMHGTISCIRRALDQPGLTVRTTMKMGDWSLDSLDLRMVEALIGRDSGLQGMKLEEADFHERFGVSVLAIGRSGRSVAKRGMSDALDAGDTLLFVGREADVVRLRRNRDLFLLESQPLPVLGRSKAFVTLALLLLMVLASATRLLSPSFAIPLVGFLAIVFGCISAREAYASLDLHALVVVGALIPFGFALEDTGTTLAIGEAAARGLGELGPTVVLAGVLLVTVSLTQVIENTAAAVILAPIAYELAVSTGGDPRRFCLGVAICVSSAFMTPVAHESTILVMGPGRYEFRDYVRMGAPMVLVTWLVTTLVLSL